MRFSPNSMAYLLGSGVHSLLGVSYEIAWEDDRFERLGWSSSSAAD